MEKERYVLIPDKKGALWSGLFHGSALFMSGILSYEYYGQGHPSVLFYVFFFSFWLALFSGYTSVLNNCLLLTPRSLKSVTTTDKSVILEWKNGDADEIVRKLNFQGGRTILGVWGDTVDKRRVQATIRRNSVTKEQFTKLLKELEGIRDSEKSKN
ncbi:MULTISPECIES: hypothetical protein [Leptospirillum]|jgi:hypothetical protein|uniref:Uncharacterized protein n=2 Tax=Leptospirillum ferriphilum TaxID=178606 RepID=A0A059XTG2_9BACT|nr:MULTISPECIES: hypothetical protein [Leptospirillum]EAY56738.1 MAG: protein of unknown function [Leptospirillum rubarum]EIJ76662.1 MAG: hypothetical protein C75L2_00380027 [Leptospirillum sp. Group II 'C75']MCL4405766.1 hypothetical protein [Bacillota bacterium]MCL5259389.1 hypothetical protein [Nitrospirota bacterium]AIA31904.1 hypothetical protein Y981_09940 [Leptospirillum ferriphilum YSK]